jgi:hypothetical protein
MMTALRKLHLRPFASVRVPSSKKLKEDVHHAEVGFFDFVE